MEHALILTNAKMVPITAGTTRFVRIHEGATIAYVQEGIDPRELEDPVWILMNVKTEMPVSMSVETP